VNHRASSSKRVVQTVSSRLAWDSFRELILTFILLFGVTSIVRWVIGPSIISRVLPGIHAELWIVGSSVALLLAVLIQTPMGRSSGSHTNPAISFAMWRFGVFPGAGVLPYAAAQLLGSVLGVVAARAVWGGVIAKSPVTFAALQPATGWPTWYVFATEATGMAVIVFLIGSCLSVQRLAPFVPWIVGGLVGLGIALLGTGSGGSLNPARQFGPAVLSGKMQFLWVYLTAPLVGAFIATGLRSVVQSHHFVLTHRLCGTVDDRDVPVGEGTSGRAETTEVQS
jgi:glycerol uptake facilitator-like aquaporin